MRDDFSRGLFEDREGVLVVRGRYMVELVLKLKLESKWRIACCTPLAARLNRRQAKNLDITKTLNGF